MSQDWLLLNNDSNEKGMNVFFIWLEEIFPPVQTITNRSSHETMSTVKTLFAETLLKTDANDFYC